jgi:thioredoxin-like negative regulator of GroEL
MKQIHLFVQEGCRPCMYAETQLKKVEGWENVVSITNAKEDGEWSDFAKQCGVEATPTLVALIDGNIVARMAGSQDMTSTFWQATISNHGK